jgi:predicted metal-dependent peptidase
MSAEEIFNLLPDEPAQNFLMFFIDSDGGIQSSNSSGNDKGKIVLGDLIAHPASGKTESEQAEAEAFRRAMVADAVVIAKAIGNMPGSLAQLVDGIITPKINWVDKLRLFIEVQNKADYNWVKPNRRYNNVILPSLDSKSAGTFVIAVDTSGSISNDDLEQFASEISAILETVNPEKIIVLHVDATINNVEEFSPSDLPIQLHVVGRGGTSFVPAFDWVNENDTDPKCFIYLTDLYGVFYTKQVDYPVLWVTPKNGDVNAKIPFGELIVMD